ncbi:hypothetical protein CBS101457_005032 [Exobasidium rhododendri]|nr:hypothetical protein CBS101457_005032 [Exobasidium rhododendri]
MSKINPPIELGFWEQTAIATIIQNNAFFSGASVEVPRDWFNVYAYLTINETSGELHSPFPPGNFLTHLVGPDKYKSGWYEFYLTAGEGSDRAYHSDTVAKLLQEEVSDFWTDRSFRSSLRNAAIRTD